MKTLTIFKVTSRANDLNWIGKTMDGEYVASQDAEGTRLYGYTPVHAEDTADDQNYVTCTSGGCAEFSDLKKLTKKDREFLEDAYEGEISYCTECNIAHDTETVDYDGAYRFTEDGLICTGCFDNAVVTDPNLLKSHVNKPDQCITLNAAETLTDKGTLKFIERFIGGMVDGRGGSWGGTRVREGMPKSVYAELKLKNPKRNYVFSHDESGQFQTYFSVWQVLKSK